MAVLSKKIEMFLIEGRPFGLRYVDIKNKTIRALVAPLTSLDDLLRRPELQKPGVYVLYGRPDNSDRPLVYVGESEQLASRIPQHRKKDFWKDIIVFTALDETLDKAGVTYIESVLFERIKRDKVADLEFGKQPGSKTLSEANMAVMNDYIDDIVFLLQVLRYDLFNPGHQLPEHAAPDAAELKIVRKAFQATGRVTDTGFIVHAGSLSKKSLLGSASPLVKTLQSDLIERGILQDDLVGKELVFSQDYPFNSPSLAASLILGRSSNGPKEWKNADGKTLKEIQAGLD